MLLAGGAIRRGEEIPHPFNFDFEGIVKGFLARWTTTHESGFDSKLIPTASDVHPPDHVCSPEQGKGIVPQLAFRGRCVCLEAIGPSPEMLEAPPIPNQRIEGRQEANIILRSAAVQAACWPYITDPVRGGAL